jgi:Glycosyl transferase family 2
MKLAMTLIVRNEADIIEDNLRYHRAQGVDLFIVLDNGSTDGTVEMLEPYEREGILTVLHRPGTMLTIQRKGNTEIARLAHEMGADWVFHNDADEFWWPFNGGNLKETFERIPENQGVVLIPRTEFIPRPDGPESFAERLTIRESRFRRPPKTAHRTHPAIKLWSTHPIDLWVKREAPPRSGLVGKPSLRVKATHKEERELDLVLAPEFPIGSLHFPLRSFEQYRKKIAIADHNKMWERNEETRALHDAYSSGRLEEVFSNLLLDDETVEAGLEEGWLAEDTNLRDYLRACPGGLEDGEAPPGSRAWPEGQREAALAGLREDGMYLISRYMQTVASKKRKRHLDARELKSLRARVKESRRELRELERRSRRLERRSRRLEKVEKSRWWRIRPRLPARRRPDH